MNLHLSSTKEAVGFRGHAAKLWTCHGAFNSQTLDVLTLGSFHIGLCRDYIEVR